MEPPRDKEEALAGLLNGTVITLLGAAPPALFLVAVAWNWRDALDGDLLTISNDTALAIGALVLSPRILRYGLRMLHLNWASLRKL